MAFTNPLLLIGLTAILIPIVIHLFNFRRYKTVYFSNVKLLDEIKRKTRRESQLQHLVVLLLRILGIVALVFAFAQPYIPARHQKSRHGNVVSVFLDNSYSMDAGSKDGTLFYDAVDAARAIVDAFAYSDDFVLTTQDFSGEESHLLNKDEMLEMLDKVQISPRSRNFRDIVAFEGNTCSNSRKGNALHYYISDFQKNNFEIAALNTDSTTHNFLIPMSAKKKNNVAVDSCRFRSPVFKTGNAVTLLARIHNYGTEDIDKLPVKLYINGKQKAIAAIDLKAGTYTDCRMNYHIETPGTQCGRVVIEDAPIVFDDELFFTYTVTEHTHVLTINDKTPNRFLDALYGQDSVFSYQSMLYTQVNYSELKNCQVVVLNEVPNISSGMADELVRFVHSGGTLLVLPAMEMDKTGWTSFLNKLGVNTYDSLNVETLRCNYINTESIYFKDAFETTNEAMDMPTILQYYTLGGGSRQGSETVMKLENGMPLLNAYNSEKGKVILSAVAMQDEYGNAHRHTLFFVALHNIGIMNIMQNRLYNIIGIDQMQTVPQRNDNSDNLFSLVSEKSKADFIPEQRSVGNETALYFHDQVREGGFYALMKDGIRHGTLAFNADRKESDLDCYPYDDLQKMTRSSRYNTEVISPDSRNLTKDVTDKLNGHPLWPWFVLLSLLCFLVEIILLRYWGKPKINKMGTNKL